MNEIKELEKKIVWINNLQTEFLENSISYRKELTEIITQSEKDRLEIRILFYSRMSEILKARTSEAVNIIAYLKSPYDAYLKTHADTLYSDSKIDILLSDLEKIQTGIENNNPQVSLEINSIKEELISIVEDENFRLL